MDIEVLKAVKTQLIGTVQTLASLVEVLEGQISAAQPPPTHDENGNCLHPPDALVSAQAMGKNRNRFACQVCGEYVWIGVNPLGKKEVTTDG